MTDKSIGRKTTFEQISSNSFQVINKTLFTENILIQMKKYQCCFGRYGIGEIIIQFHRRIHNPIKHLGENFLQKELPALNY